MYAYDGSGLVTRSDRKDIAKFTTGKIYHADLSASYNIANRYFIRAILKPRGCLIMSVCYSLSCIYDKEALSITGSLDGEVHEKLLTNHFIFVIIMYKSS